MTPQVVAGALPAVAAFRLEGVTYASARCGTDLDARKVACVLGCPCVASALVGADGVIAVVKSARERGRV